MIGRDRLEGAGCLPKWTEIWQPERMKAEDSGQRMKAGRTEAPLLYA